MAVCIGGCHMDRSRCLFMPGTACTVAINSYHVSHCVNITLPTLNSILHAPTLDQMDILPAGMKLNTQIQCVYQ